MQHSALELFVAYSSDPYGGTSMAGESVFTDHAEALALRDSMNAASRAMMPGSPVHYHVTDLSNFMRLAQDDARDNGSGQDD